MLIPSGFDFFFRWILTEWAQNGQNVEIGQSQMADDSWVPSNPASNSTPSLTGKAVSCSPESSATPSRPGFPPRWWWYRNWSATWLTYDMIGGPATERFGQSSTPKIDLFPCVCVFVCAFACFVTTLFTFFYNFFCRIGWRNTVTHCDSVRSSRHYQLAGWRL